MKSIIKIIVCCLVFLFQQEAEAQCLPLQRGSSRNLKTFNTTGVAKFDEYLNAEKKYLEKIFAVKVKMKILDDSDAPNAYATKDSDNPLSFDGSVYLGISLIAEELKAENGLASVNGIMAHEFAHILQEKLNCTLEGSKRELHADFLAGFYMGQRGTYTNAEISAFGMSIYSKGEGEIWSPSHHGTPQQRLQSLLAGYHTSTLTDSPSDAYQAGILVLNEDGDLGGGTQKESEPEVTPSKTNYVVRIGDVKYSKGYVIEYEVARIKYAGIFFLENGKGVMRLKFNDTIVEEDMEVTNSETAGKFFKGSNPRNAITGRTLANYAPDNFFFETKSDGSQVIWVVDSNANSAQVKSSLETESSKINEWLAWLKWSK
jgi:hypothetical protein